MFCKNLALKQKTDTLNQFDNLDQKIAEILSESDLYFLETTTTLKDYIHKRLIIFNLGLHKEGKTFLDKQKNGLFFNVWWVLCFKQAVEFEFSIQSEEGESKKLCERLVNFIYRNTNTFESIILAFKQYNVIESEHNNKVEYFFNILNSAFIDTRKQQDTLFTKEVLNKKSEIILSKFLNMESSIFNKNIWKQIPLKLCIDVKDFNKLLQDVNKKIYVSQDSNAVFFIPTFLIGNILASKSHEMLKFMLKYDQYLHRSELCRDINKMQIINLVLQNYKICNEILFNNLQFNLVDSKDNQIYKSSSELMKQIIDEKYSIDQDSVEILQELLNSCNKIRVNYKNIKFDEKESVMTLLDKMNNALEKKIKVIQLKLKIKIEEDRIKALQQALLGDESKKEIKTEFFNANPDAKDYLSSQYVLSLAVFNIIEGEYGKVDPLIKELGGLVYT